MVNTMTPILWLVLPFWLGALAFYWASHWQRSHKIPLQNAHKVILRATGSCLILASSIAVQGYVPNSSGWILSFSIITLTLLTCILTSAYSANSWRWLTAFFVGLSLFSIGQ